MPKIFSRIAGFFSIRTPADVDKSWSRYFTRVEEIDGIAKEKRWVVFRGEQDPTTIPVEWICWLNGQRKRPPTLEDMSELEARHEQVRLNVECLKEEEEKKLKDGSICPVAAMGKVGGLDLKSFIRQFPGSSEGEKGRDTSDVPDNLRKPEEQKPESNMPEEFSEPSGSGASFKPGHGNHRLNCLPCVEIWCMHCSRTSEDREVTVTTVKLRTLHVLFSFVIDSSILVQTREMLQGLYKLRLT